MQLYEFITPSDPITFYAPDIDVAEAISLFVGNGKAGFRSFDNIKTPNTMTVFSGGIQGEQLERFKKVMDERIDEVIAAGRTFAVCSKSYREEYDTLTENSTNTEQIEKWDERHRSSMNNWCGYARSLKIKVRS